MANESDYELACLLMVFVAVSIPTLAKKDVSVFKASLEGKYNYNFKIIYRKVIECSHLFGILFSKFRICQRWLIFFSFPLYTVDYKLNSWKPPIYHTTSIPQLYICLYMFIYTCITGNLSNCHCLAKAVNQIAGALFTIHGPGDVSDRLQEFLAVSLTPPRKK